MTIVAYHHPYTRAAVTLWMLEEVGLEYELRYVDIMAGEHKKPEMHERDLVRCGGTVLGSSIGPGHSPSGEAPCTRTVEVTARAGHG